MRPIPKRLLIHRLSVSEMGEKDRWGNAAEGQKKELSFVRIEPSGKIVRGKDNVEVQLAATLFYDCLNSRPKGQTFSQGMILTFMGEKYRVQTVEPLYDGKKLHHYEIGLVRHG